MNSSGLTLIEILVALTVLAIGASGLVAMQLSTLRLARQTQIQTRLLHVADSELQLRLLGAASGMHCSAVIPEEAEGIACSVSTESCAALLEGFECAAATGGTSRRITVTASREDGATVMLSAVTRVVAGP